MNTQAANLADVASNITKNLSNKDFSGAMETAKSGMAAVKDMVGDKLEDVTDVVNDKIGDIKEAVSGAPDSVKETVSNVLDGASKVFNNLASKLSGK